LVPSGSSSAWNRRLSVLPWSPNEESVELFRNILRNYSDYGEGMRIKNEHLRERIRRTRWEATKSR
jgi:hypothetical protein